MKKTTMLLILIVVFAFASSAYLYPELPDVMASHWNIAGEVDGYMHKGWGVFLLPVLAAVTSAVLYFLPSIDPLRANIQKFRKYYDEFIVIFSAFLVFVHLQVLLWNAGIRINPNTTIPVGLGFLMLYLGFMLDKSKRNWFIGIRTPWTLSSDVVWEKTHKLGSKLFIAAALLIMASALFPGQAVLLIIGSVLLVVLVTLVYSYLEYRKLEHL